MKKIAILLCFLLTGFTLSAQQAKALHEIDSLKSVFENARHDYVRGLKALTDLTATFESVDLFDSSLAYNRRAVELLPSDSTIIDRTVVDILTVLGGAYQFHNLDSAILFNRRAFDYARRINYRVGEMAAAGGLGENLRLNGDLLGALEMLYYAMSIAKELGSDDWVAMLQEFIGVAYVSLGESRTGIDFIFKGLSYKSSTTYKPLHPFLLSNIADGYERLDKLDSALYYQLKALALANEFKTQGTPLRAQLTGTLGNIYARMGNAELAKQYYRESINYNDHLNLGLSQYFFAKFFYDMGQVDSSLYFGEDVEITIKDNGNGMEEK